MTDPNYTHIALVVDCSGSMAAIQQDAQGAINTFIDEQKKVPGLATFTLVEFDNTVQIVHENVPLAGIGEYTLRPRGTTALLDAWGQTVDITGQFLEKLPEDQRPGHVIIVIVTDGQENASKEYTQPQVKEMTERQRNDYAWEFVFLAANQDAVEQGQRYGVATQSSLTYTASPDGAVQSYAAVSRAVAGVRVGTAKGVVFDDKDRDAAKGTK